MKLFGLILFALLFIISLSGCQYEYYFGLDENLVCFVIPLVSIILCIIIILSYIKSICDCLCNIFTVMTCCYFKKKIQENPEIAYRQFV